MVESASGLPGCHSLKMSNVMCSLISQDPSLKSCLPLCTYSQGQYLCQLLSVRLSEDSPCHSPSRPRGTAAECWSLPCLLRLGAHRKGSEGPRGEEVYSLNKTHLLLNSFCGGTRLRSELPVASCDVYSASHCPGKVSQGSW